MADTSQAQAQSSQHPDPQELLAKTRALVEKLRAHDAATTDILLKTRRMEKQEEAIDELQDLLTKYSTVPFLRVRRSALVQDLHQENRVLRALRQENDALCSAVQENNDVIQFIMKKYHQHSRKLSDLQRQDSMVPQVINKVLTAVAHENAGDLEEMIFLTQTAVEMDEKTGRKRTEFLQKVTRENVALRHALKVADRDAAFVSSEMQTELRGTGF